MNAPQAAQYKTVPVEPTEEMWRAVNNLDDEMAAGSYDGKRATIEQIWNCLVAAAPTPPAPASQSIGNSLPAEWKDRVMDEMDRRFKLRGYDDDHMRIDDTQIGVEFACDQISSMIIVPAPAAEPQGFAWVPLRPTKAMSDVMDTEGWSWPDLLAAAEAITEDQYSALSAAPAAESAEPVAWFVEDTALGKTYITQSAMVAGKVIESGGKVLPLIYGDAPTAATADAAERAEPADYEKVLADHRRLVRELDVLLNGEDGAASQASLCDLVQQVRTQFIKGKTAATADAQGDERAVVTDALCRVRSALYGYPPSATRAIVLGELDNLGAALSRQPSAAASAEHARPLIARALSEWHDDDGPVMWWAWCGHEWAGEPAWCGQPTDSDWPGYHTHWTLHPKAPDALAAAEPEGGE